MPEHPYVPYLMESDDARDAGASADFEQQLAGLFDLWSHHQQWTDPRDYEIAERMHKEVLLNGFAHHTLHPPSQRQLARYFNLGGRIALGHQNWLTALDHFRTCLGHIPENDVLARLHVLYAYADVCYRLQDFLQAAYAWEGITEALSAILKMDIDPSSHTYYRAALCEAHTRQGYFALALGDYGAVSSLLMPALHLLFRKIEGQGIAIPQNDTGVALPFSPWEVLVADNGLVETLTAFLHTLPEDDAGALWRRQAFMTPWTWALGEFYLHRLGMSDHSGIYQQCFGLMSELADVYLATQTDVPFLMFTLLIDIPFAGLHEARQPVQRGLWLKFLQHGYATADACWQTQPAPDLAEAASHAAALGYLERASLFMVRYGQMVVKGLAIPRSFIADVEACEREIQANDSLPRYVRHLVGKLCLLRGIIAVGQGQIAEARRAFFDALATFNDEGLSKGFIPRQHEVERLLAAIKGH